MASSNIKLFDENKGNMSSDTEYSSDAQRLNGVQTGIASSKLQNKTLYQTTLVAYAIAQLMIANNLNANDSDAVSTFVSNLSSAILQPKDFATSTEAAAGTATNKIINPSTLASVISGKFATQAEVNAGSITNKYVSPATDYAAITNRMATAAEADTGTSTVKIINPSTLARRVNTREASKVTRTASLAVASWNSSLNQSVTVSGVTASNTVEVSPAPASFDAYSKARVYCSAQAANSLTFHCSIKPTVALTVNVIIWS